MGYACPVCETPQMDAEHLANHLAFTAMLGDDAHEAWLDEHAPGWADQGEAELSERVVEYAESEEFPQVFEDTTEDAPADAAERSGALFEDDHEHAHDHPNEHASGAHQRADALDEVLEEARELTRRMLADAEDEDENE